MNKNPYLAQTRKSGNLIDFPPKSTEIIEIYSISDFGTLFFVFFTFQRGFVQETVTVLAVIDNDARSARKNVTLVTDIEGFPIDVQRADLFKSAFT